jgi:flagellar motility protein MotE (MotC chaperone)
MWRLLCFSFLLLSLATVGWLSHELDLFASSSDPAAAKAQGSVEAISKQLDDRAKALDKREADLKKRERELGEKQGVMTTQIARYEKEIESQRARLKHLETLEDTRTEEFRHVYERMDPKKAAKILGDLDVGMAGRIISGMKQEHAAEILSEMASYKARLITEKILSNRKLANVPQEKN